MVRCSGLVIHEPPAPVPVIIFGGFCNILECNAKWLLVFVSWLSHNVRMSYQSSGGSPKQAYINMKKAIRGDLGKARKGIAIFILIQTVVVTVVFVGFWIWFLFLKG